MPLTKITVAFDFPFSPVKFSAEWEPSEVERVAAWEMYVELATRVTVVELPDGRGLVREALNSYYSLFATTRAILKAHGPALARPAKGADTSFGQLAVVILNDLLRPFLSEWHPALHDWEAGKPPGESSVAHERAWPRGADARNALEQTRAQLERYAGYLANVAGIPVLTSAPANASAN